MTLRYTRRYATLPALAPRGPMPPMVSVIIPIARANEVTNPSIELATTGYTAVGGSIARSAAQQYHGTYALAITPTAGVNDGAFYGTIATTAGQTRAISCKFKGQPGIPYKLSIATTGGADLAVDAFVATGRWQWRVLYYTEVATTTRRIYFTKNNHASTAVFYVDGVQSEVINAGELVSTYIDGDQLGLLVGQQPPAYGWNGAPHASTSYRSALTRAGGYVVNLSMYNFILTALIGLGMAVPNNVSIPYTILDGARFQRTTKPPRTLSLAGRWQSDDAVAQFVAASEMRAVLDRDLVSIQQPMVLMVEPRDECDTVIGDFAQLACIYAGGLEGNDGNMPVEDVAPTFTMYVPYLTGGDAGVALSPNTSLSNTRGIIKRNPDGTWAPVGTGVTTSNPVYTIIVARDGKVYAGGGFTQMGGVANTSKIAYFDPADNAWHAMGTGGSGTGDVWALVEGPDGSIYAGGDFTAMGGVANTKCIARWTGSAWVAMGTGGVAATTQVRALQFNNAGTLLYVGGNFTDIGGSGADYLATWSGSAWASVGGAAAINAPVFALARQPNSPLGMYVGGQFTNAGAVADADYIAAWSGTAYTGLSTGMNTDVNTIVVRPNGIVYAGGAFTVAGGVAVTYNAQWNGTKWEPIGTGMNALVNAIGQPPNVAAFYFGGGFNTAGPLTLSDGLVLWTGSAFAYPDVDLSSASGVYAIAQALDGTLYLGTDGTSLSTSAAITSVTNDAPGIVYPKLTVRGPSSGTSRIYQLANYTTGIAMFLDLTLSAGETAVFDLDPTHPTAISSFQGDISGRIIPGSGVVFLGPGTNSMSFFAASSTVEATLSWQKRYNGMADLVN